MKAFISVGKAGGISAPRFPRIDILPLRSELELVFRSHRPTDFHETIFDLFRFGEPHGLFGLVAFGLNCDSRRDIGSRIIRADVVVVIIVGLCLGHARPRIDLVHADRLALVAKRTADLGTEI